MRGERPGGRKRPNRLFTKTQVSANPQGGMGLTSPGASRLRGGVLCPEPKPW